MGEFIFTLIAVALLNGAVNMISPDGELKGYVRLVGSLCIVIAVVAPIFSLVSENIFDTGKLFPDTEGAESLYEQTFAESIADGMREVAEKGIKEGISKELGLPDGKFDVVLNIETYGEAYRASSVTVILYGIAIPIDPREIRAYAEEVAGCECTVIYGER